jgi:hypothetical protein
VHQRLADKAGGPRDQDSLRTHILRSPNSPRAPITAVESFFTKLTQRRLKRGVFQSIKDLKAAINRFVAETNAKPEPSGPPIHAASSPL